MKTKTLKNTNTTASTFTHQAGSASTHTSKNRSPRSNTGKNTSTITLESRRKKCLALIHIQKARAGLTDDEYSSLLLGTVGVDSAAKVKSLAQLNLVIGELNKILKAKGINPRGNYTQKDKAFLNAVKARATTVLGTHSEKRLAGFLKKLGKQKLEDCTSYELRRVMGFLSTVERSGTTDTSYTTTSTPSANGTSNAQARRGN
ncbi:MAG: hypothetical protein P1P64_03350 [Treponemataceae bacterium]